MTTHRQKKVPSIVAGKTKSKVSARSVKMKQVDPAAPPPPVEAVLTAEFPASLHLSLDDWDRHVPSEVDVRKIPVCRWILSIPTETLAKYLEDECYTHPRSGIVCYTRLTVVQRQAVTKLRERPKGTLWALSYIESARGRSRAERGNMVITLGMIATSLGMTAYFFRGWIKEAAERLLMGIPYSEPQASQHA